MFIQVKRIREVTATEENSEIFKIEGSIPRGSSADDLPDDLPIVTLAYIGDAVYELYVRCHLVKAGLRKAGDLSREAVAFSSALGQSARMNELLPVLSAKEIDVYKRGRNYKRPRQRHMLPVDYARATGLEALVGYLYCEGESKRLNQIFDIIFCRTIKKDEDAED